MLSLLWALFQTHYFEIWLALFSYIANISESFNGEKVSTTGFLKDLLRFINAATQWVWKESLLSSGNQTIKICRRGSTRRQKIQTTKGTLSPNSAAADVESPSLSTNFRVLLYLCSYPLGACGLHFPANGKSYWLNMWGSSTPNCKRMKYRAGIEAVTALRQRR